MDTELELRKGMLADPTIARMVGTRIFPLMLPQQAVFPAITYQRVSTVRNERDGSYSHDGYSGMGWARFQVSIWSDDYGQITELAAAMRAFLHAFVTSPWNGQPMNKLLNEMDTDEPERDLFQRIIDARIWFQESK
jgi:hypothetical protein